MITFKPVFANSSVTNSQDGFCSTVVVGYEIADVDYSIVIDRAAHFGEVFGAYPSSADIGSDIVAWCSAKDSAWRSVSERALVQQLALDETCITRGEAETLALAVHLWLQERCDVFLAELAASRRFLTHEL